MRWKIWVDDPRQVFQNKVIGNIPTGMSQPPSVECDGRTKPTNEGPVQEKPAVHEAIRGVQSITSRPTERSSDLLEVPGSVYSVVVDKGNDTLVEHLANGNRFESAKHRGID